MIQSWGNDGRLANRRLEVSANSVRLSTLTYSYDNSDNFTAINDTLVAARSNTYTYDAMDRITRRVTGEGTYPREDYVYDTNGNRLSVQRRTSATAPTAAETDQYLIAGGTNRLSRIISPVKNRTFTYDDRGNLTGERWPDNSLITTAYDGHARLTSYGAGGATQAMLYNGEDERIRVVTTPAVGLTDTRIYIYDLDNRIVGEYGDAGVSDVKAEYIWLMPEVGASGPTGGDDGTGGYMPLAIAKGQTGALNWVHSHHNAKPIMLTDSTGATVAYSGHAVLGFPGQFANAVGLAGAQYYYNYYRDYDDTTGRYIHADPIGLNGDPNPYAYAMGNGLRYSDPRGEIAWLIPMAIGAGIGAGTDIAFQAAMNALQGRDVFDINCYSWRQVGISAGLGAIGGGVGAWANRSPALINEGVYEFVGRSGLKYVGQSGVIPARIAQHIASGKLPISNVGGVIPRRVLGGRVPREVAEQKRINQLGGIKNLENQRNPIGRNRQNLMDKKR